MSYVIDGNEMTTKWQQRKMHVFNAKTKKIDDLIDYSDHAHPSVGSKPKCNCDWKSID